MLLPMLLGAAIVRVFFTAGARRVAPCAPALLPAATSLEAPSLVQLEQLHRRWRALKDEEPIHIFHAICAAGTAHHDMDWHGLTVIKTILMAREVGPSKNRRYHFHVAIDRNMRRLMTMLELRTDFADTLAYIANRTDGKVSVSWYDVDSEVIGATAAAVGDTAASAVSNDLFKTCSTIRLRLPFIAGALNVTDRLLYVDFDSIVTCDLESMWEEELATLGAAEGAFIAVTPEAPHAGYPTAYRPDPGMKGERLHPSKFKGGLNAGVMAVRLDRWRAVARTFWDDVADIVAHGGYDAFNLTVHGKHGLNYGDQVCRRVLPPPSLPRVHVYMRLHRRLSGRRISSTSCPTADLNGSRSCTCATTGDSSLTSLRSNTTRINCRRVKRTSLQFLACNITWGTERLGACAG